VNRLLSVLLWSILAAAFIGPGTVTTAALAGSRFGPALLWALTFSTIACVVLQEAGARLTLASGRDLGQALRRRFGGGWRGIAILFLVLGAIVVGCAAYEAGNILGGVSGAALAVDLPRPFLTLASGLVAGLLLWFNKPKTVAHLLGVLVAVMGVAFLCTAVLLRPGTVALARGATVPSLPVGSAVLALGLVGTTVVPYNLFLGSGLARGQTLREMRFGLAVAVGLGGLISAGVLIVGTAVGGEFSFPALAAVLSERLGEWARSLFAAGLLSAGLSSAVTAPLAAALTARSLFASADTDPRWNDRSWRYRAVWLLVLTVGLGFGLSGVRPIPAIIVAQALNGVLLPLVAVFLLLAVNDRSLMGDAAANGRLANLIMGAVVAVSLLLGAGGLLRAGAAALGREAPPPLVAVVVAAPTALLVAVAIWRQRRR
jgi:Mn2+/Fe2+ NRAMP family transporter